MAISFIQCLYLLKDVCTLYYITTGYIIFASAKPKGKEITT